MTKNLGPNSGFSGCEAALVSSWAQKLKFFGGFFIPDLQILNYSRYCKRKNHPVFWDTAKKQIFQTLQFGISKCPANLGPNICWSAWPLSTESKVDEALFPNVRLFFQTWAHSIIVPTGWSNLCGIDPSANSKSTPAVEVDSLEDPKELLVVNRLQPAPGSSVASGWCIEIKAQFSGGQSCLRKKPAIVRYQKSQYFVC